ncbi:MAG TPA: FxSxx-COOH system tetratricopeptide repeat protein [Geodermatophilus sp.]|nr:FxSxx-COOH system tetratricopeptide repeat protein [Geodermatophilus sp.]
MSGRRTDFFISHAGKDTAWAEWLAWQLQQASYTVELAVWDWALGEDFVARMQSALERTDRLLAVCTEAYFTSTYGGAELRAAFAQQAAGRIVPVLIEPVTLPGLYAPLIPVDLTGLDEAAAAARLLARLAGGRPTSAPAFPRAGPAPGDKPGFAGRLPKIWKVPPRNPRFTGRDGLLTELRQRLRAHENTLVVQALYGLGGVGKTQLAIEYAHRFAADYDLVWWIDAEQPVLIPEQLAALAERLELSLGPTVTDTVDRLLAELARRPRWLLIFDNAEGPQDIADYRPGGAGHVLVTSRSPGWGSLGGRLEVDVLARAETIALLRARIPELGEELADTLAAELGDLPLAAAQAAGYLEQTALPAADYLRRFRARRASLLSRGEVVGYSGRLDTTWALSLEWLRDQDQAAVQLLELVAFLAPEPIPLFLISEHADLLETPLRTVATDPDALADTLGALVGYSLARRSPDGFQLHRLMQAVIRHQLPPDRQQATAERVVALLAAASPGDPDDPASWTTYAALAPHVLATAPLGDSSLAGRRLVLDTARCLQTHGDNRASRAVSERLLDRWRAILGADHPDTLAAATSLTLALIQLGEPASARALGHETLHRSRCVHGPDHGTTLTAATALTLALVQRGEVRPAHALAEDTLQRSRRVLGLDHPITLWAATTLTRALTELGGAERARALGQDTLQRCRRVFGPDHPTALWAATTLTRALNQLGKAEPARDLGQDTLQRSRRVFGPDHATTLSAAAALTLAWVLLGELQSARTLAEDTLQRSRRTLGPHHTTTLWSATALSHVLVQLGEAEPARDLSQGTLQRSRRVFGADHPITLWAAALTLALVHLGEVEAARALGRDTLQRCRRLFGLNYPIALSAAAALTGALDQLGEAEPARALGEDTLQRCRRALGPDHPTTLLVATALTIALAHLGEAEPSHALGDDALQRSRRVLGLDHRITQYLTEAASGGYPMPSGDSAADRPEGPP